jgi:hypothetical protein
MLCEEIPTIMRNAGETINYRCNNTPRHQPQMGKVRLSFCSDRASISATKVVIRVKTGIYKDSPNNQNHRLDMRELRHVSASPLTENSPMKPPSINADPVNTTDTTKAAVPSTVFPLEVDHRSRPILFPMMEA